MVNASSIHRNNPPPSLPPLSFALFLSLSLSLSLPLLQVWYLYHPLDQPRGLDSIKMLRLRHLNKNTLFI